MNKRICAGLAATLVSTSMLTSVAQAADKPIIVTTIPPIQSLAEALVGDLADVQPLSQAGATPHGRTLKPSDVRKLTKADLVVQVGPTLESSIQKVLKSNVEADHLLTLEGVKGIHLLEGRSGGVWGDGHAGHDHGSHEGHDDHAEESHEEHHDEHGHDEHGHDEHGHDEHGHDEHGHDEHGHDDHADEKHDDHAHEEHHEEHGHEDHAEHEGHDHDDHAEHEEKHDDHAGHDDHDEHGKEHHMNDGHVHDAHIWLSVENAKVIVEAIAHELVEHHPELKGDLEAREAAVMAKLDKLDADLSKQLASLGDVSYLVFHDAYQYFEEGYGLKPAGAVLLDPERKPGAKRLSELRHFVEENNVKCVFTEPQFQPKLVKVLQEDTNLQTGELDPLGFGLEAGENLYFELMGNLASSLEGCLTK